VKDITGSGELTESSQELAAEESSQELAAEESSRALAAEESSRALAGDASSQALAEESSQVLATELLGAISAVRRIARRTVRSAWHEEPLPPAQSELLRLTTARPGISVADAAHELRLAPNTVSTLVGRLTAAGLLGRTRSASDGRSVRLAVTGKATRRIAGFRDLRAELAGRALDRLTAGDRQALAAAVPALHRLAAQLEEESA
jgi:DNA-binding MarR family transcriptional regulator